jgi:hypothetical protein
LPALAFAAQSPYPGWQNVIYSRNVMRNAQMVNKIYEHCMCLKQKQLKTALSGLKTFI